MKVLIPLLLFVASLCPAQEALQAVNTVYPVYNNLQQATQYEASVLSGSIYPSKARSKFSLTCLDNCVKYQTVYGVHQLYFVSHKGGCLNGCFFTGTLDTYEQTQVTSNGNYFIYSVSGTLTGTFTDPQGNVHPNTMARYHFETIPANWRDMGLEDFATGLGTLDVVLQLD